MFTQARVAQFGLVAVAGVFLTCMGILGGRAAERASLPTLVDIQRATARVSGVAQTPAVCVIDRTVELRQQGSFDDTRKERLVAGRPGEDATAGVMGGQSTRTKFTQVFDGADSRSK